MLECLLGPILIDFGPQNRPRPGHHSGTNSGRGGPGSSWRRSFVFLSLLASFWGPPRPLQTSPGTSHTPPNPPPADFGSIFDQFSTLAGIKKQAKSLEGCSFLDLADFGSICDRFLIDLGSFLGRFWSLLDPQTRPRRP